MNPVVQVSGLNKSYGKFVAVNNVSFNVLEGEVFGILGPNGAGKTTTLEIIEGLLPYSSGEVTILDRISGNTPKTLKANLAFSYSPQLTSII